MSQRGNYGGGCRDGRDRPRERYGGGGGDRGSGDRARDRDHDRDRDWDRDRNRDRNRDRDQHRRGDRDATERDAGGTRNNCNKRERGEREDVSPEVRDSSRRKGVSNVPAWMQEGGAGTASASSSASASAGAPAEEMVEMDEFGRVVQAGRPDAHSTHTTRAWALSGSDVLLSKKFLGDARHAELETRFQRVLEDGQGGGAAGAFDTMVAPLAMRRTSMGGIGLAAAGNGDMSESSDESDGDDDAGDDADMLDDMDDLYGDLTGGDADEDGEEEKKKKKKEKREADRLAEPMSEAAALEGDKSEYAGMRVTSTDDGEDAAGTGRYGKAVVPYALQNLSSRRLRTFAKAQRGYDWAALYNERLVDFQSQFE